MQEIFTSVEEIQVSLRLILMIYRAEVKPIDVDEELRWQIHEIKKLT